MPYAIFHAVTRSRWLRVKRPEAKGAKRKKEEAPIVDPLPAVPVRLRVNQVNGWLRDTVYTRRAFLTWSVAGILLVIVGPKFARWLFSGSVGNSTLRSLIDANQMMPEPIPLPESVQPLGGGAKGDFRIYTIVNMPAFTDRNWKFWISGLVDRRLEWNWEQFLQLPRKVQVSDFHCVTGWSVYSMTWEGIPLKELLAMAGVQGSAKFVKFYSGDGVYTDCLTLEQANIDDVLVAVMMDGKPIVRDLGGPVRLIVPKMYAYKSVKWLRNIELIAEEHVGFWEMNGYDQHAWVPGKKPGNVKI
ncbi:MAG: oxidoreductase [Paenibacillus sp.]|nr:oxidoreductase [Paenibacillus sp.]